MAQLPPGSRVLTPCETHMDAKTSELRCLHQHTGKHLRTTPGASVTLLPSGLAHVVESCGRHAEEHADTAGRCGGEDPYVLWYVMAAPASAAPGLQGMCNTPTPYAPLSTYTAGVPNPNNPDPSGVQSIMTRHWPAGGSVPYVINIPPGTPLTNDIFAANPLTASPGSVLPVVYTWSTFFTDIPALMNSVFAIPTADTPRPILSTYPPGMAPNYNAAIPAGGVFPGSGQFVWAHGQGGACGGPTGNAINEFIFLPGGTLGLPGGVASMLLDATTGTITECDVILEATSTVWTGIDVQTNSGLAHEIGHFWGLDHTNLNPGGAFFNSLPALATSAQPGFPGTFGAVFASVNDIPAMTSGFTRTTPTLAAPITPARNRVFSPWVNDDIAGFSALYPVKSLTSAVGKTPLINTTATIIGSLLDRTGAGRGSFGDNLFVVHQAIPQTSMGAPLPGTPQVGTVSGTYRSGPRSVTGSLDTLTTATCTGEFRLDGIPILVNGAPTSGGISEYALFVEPLGSIGLGAPHLGATVGVPPFFAVFFGEWWYEFILNSANNPLALPFAPISYAGHFSNGLNALTSVSLCGVNSMLMAEGTIIRLDTPIDTTPLAPSGSPVQIELVSRPLIQVTPRNPAAPMPGTTLTITVSHNRVAGGASLSPTSPWPLQSLTCNWGGKMLPTAFVSSIVAPSPNGGTMYVSTYSVAIPASMPPQATVTVLGLEAPDPVLSSVRSVVGENQVVY